MKKIVWIMGLVLLTACVGEPPRKDFDASRKVQTIAVTSRHHIYAQDDTLMKYDSLDEKLASMNKNWKDDLSNAHLYHDFALASFFTQVATLGVCIFQNNTVNVAGWCGGSILSAVATMLLFNHEESNRFKVVDQFNHPGSIQ